MNPIVKPWPFRGWGIDLIGQIYPPSSKGHKFVLVATNYFTKWVEDIPLKIASTTKMIEFIKEHVVYRFGIPQSITTDQGKMFTSQEFEDFAASTGFKLLNSSPYYAQANGQVEASNQILIKSIKKIRENLKKWHTILSETLWSYQMACHGSTKCSPYELVYGNETILPWEINISSRRVLHQDELRANDYRNLMMEMT
jgi:transposase InsO family protein